MVIFNVWMTLTSATKAYSKLSTIGDKKRPIDYEFMYSLASIHVVVICRRLTLKRYRYLSLTRSVPTNVVYVLRARPSGKRSDFEFLPYHEVVPALSSFKTTQSHVLDPTIAFPSCPTEQSCELGFDNLSSNIVDIDQCWSYSLSYCHFYPHDLSVGCLRNTIEFGLCSFCARNSHDVFLPRAFIEFCIIHDFLIQIITQFPVLF